MMASARRTGRIYWRYVLAGMCFVGLAAFQSDRGSAVWAVVFSLAALSNAYLSIRPMLPTRFGGEARPKVQWSSSSTVTPSRTLSEEMHRTLKVYEPRVRSWLVIAVAGWVVTVGVALLIPPLGLVGAALSIFATHRYLRYRRSVKILHRASAAGEMEEDAGGEGT